MNCFKVEILVFFAIFVLQCAVGGFVDTISDMPKKLGSIFTLVVKDLTSSAVGTLRHGIRPFHSNQEIVGRRPWKKNRQKSGGIEPDEDYPLWPFMFDAWDPPEYNDKVSEESSDMLSILHSKVDEDEKARANKEQPLLLIRRKRATSFLKP